MGSADGYFCLASSPAITKVLKSSSKADHLIQNQSFTAYEERNDTLASDKGVSLTFLAFAMSGLEPKILAEMCEGGCSGNQSDVGRALEKLV
jgi:hypothetical protein